MDPKETIGNAHKFKKGGAFGVEFKSLWIRNLVLDQLDFLQHLGTMFIIQEMSIVSSSAAHAGVCYEGFACQVLASGASQKLIKMTADKGSTTFSVPEVEDFDKVVSPFNRGRELFRIISPDILANTPSENLSDRYWKPIAPNNGLFDAFVIEFSSSAPEIDFDDPAQNINAVVWILQMTLSKDYGGSPKGYTIIRSIKEKVQEAMGEGQNRRGVEVKYVLVGPGPGPGTRWKLPQNNRSYCIGDVYYLPVSYKSYKITTGTVTTGT
jgi:hypothetical protein